MERNDNIKNFFREYEELCKKYNVSLAHEDSQGGFLIDIYDEENIEWVKAASDAVEERKREEEMRLNRFNKYMTWKSELRESIGVNNKVVKNEGNYKIVDENGLFIRYANTNERELTDRIERYERYELFN